MFAPPVPIVAAQSVSAWNPNVSCSAWVITFQNVTGTSGAISTPWQTSSTTGGVPNKRALSPPCTITNTKGQLVSTLVQINGIYLPHLTYGDCSTTYNSVNGGGPYPDRNGDGKADTFCDDYGDIHSIGGGSTGIHIEFDQDWLAKGYCGPGHSPCDNETITQYFSTGGISLDVQGFVYWDAGHWELHPFTAWKLSSSPQPFTTSFTYSPSNPSSGVPITFTAIASSGTPPYTFTWNFGDGGSATGSQATHVYTTSGSFTVTLTTNDSAGQTAMTSSTITINKRTTSTTIVCSPASVQIGQSSTCTASVKDTSPGTPSTPAGTVDFTNGGGSFTGTPCSLGAVNSTTANCSASYAPSGTSARTETITGTYTPAQSDTFHDGSLGTFPLSVIVAGLHSTSTSVSCLPSTVDVNQATSCTATIRDTQTSGATAPTGTVTFTPGGTCTLGNPSGPSASCSVNVTPTAAGPMSVSARYNGDSTHATSSGSTTINVNRRVTSMAVNCSPNPVTTNSSTNCTVTLNDADVGAVITPTGSVSFASNSTGTFNLLTCSLTATATTGVASCSVSYTPSIAGHHKITGSYAGDSSHIGSSGSATVTVTTQPRQQPYALVISEQGSVFKYQNGTFTLIGQPVTTPLRQVAWKPDGSYALIVGDSGVLLKYDGSQLTTIPTGITANLYALAWRPDGSYALISGSGGPLIKYDGSTLTQLQNSFSNSIRSISWNPSGTQALMVGSSGGIFLYQPSTGQVTKISSGTTQYLYSASWNPNGLYALVAGINNTVLRYDGSSVQAFDTAGLYSSSVIIHAISWDPSGTQALLVGDSGIILTYDGSRLTLLSNPYQSNLYSISWLGPTAYIAGGSGPSLTYTSGTLSTIANTTSTSLRGWAWKPT